MAWKFVEYRGQSSGIATLGMGLGRYEDGIISVEADINECLRFFNGLDVNKLAITRNILKAVGQGARSVAKKNLNKTLQRRTGNLYSHIRYVIASKTVDIYSDAESGKRTGKHNKPARYAFMLASGYTIEAKTPKGLTFNINGQWFRKHSVTVAPKDFIEPPIDRWVGSADYKARVDKAFQQQVNYWEKKITGGNLT